MTMKIQMSFLPHDDPEASLVFYRDILGFEVRNDVGSGAMRWITVGSPDQPDASIVLFPPGLEPNLTDAERASIREMMSKGSYGRITLASRDLEADFAHLKGSGATILQDPASQPWGARDCAVADPAGNVIRINEVG